MYMIGMVISIEMYILYAFIVLLRVWVPSPRMFDPWQFVCLE